jgi:hypothetical protein
VSSTALGSLLWNCAKALLAQGERAQAEDLRRQLRELAERTHVAMVRMYAALDDVELAMVDGHLEDAWARFNELAGRADELGVSVRVLLEFLIAIALSRTCGKVARSLRPTYRAGQGGSAWPPKPDFNPIDRRARSMPGSSWANSGGSDTRRTPAGQYRKHGR